ncbi:molybdenum cofactor guanylyltransferase [Novosphingobium sp. 9]|uniref:molybdenum cofactor guanylyltransferase n=1 Tax=Novosphingobium sp. 9 TaxID=2025349 RepID=UPI0028CB9099|nr:molybdenum cofactor guanylyltransferase [Novosphingobium sp. 9]
MTLILGAVIAGGLSTRFGSDKALAVYDGHTLLSRAVDTLAGWCEYVVVVGRETAPAPTLPDWPHAGMGPLGGLAAALRLAQDEGYGAVLSSSVDALGMPEDLLARLSPGPACLAANPVIGLWPVETLPVLEEILHGEGTHSMMRFAEAVGARMERLAQAPANINTPADLARLPDAG